MVQGTSAAAPIAGILVCLVFVYVFIELKPFKNPSDSNLGIVLQYSLTLFFLSALMIKVDAAPDSDADQQVCLTFPCAPWGSRGRPKIIFGASSRANGAGALVAAATQVFGYILGVVFFAGPSMILGQFALTYYKPKAAEDKHLDDEHELGVGFFLV